MQTERFLKENEPHEFSENFNKNMERLFDENTDQEALLKELEENWEQLLEEHPDLRTLSKEIDEFTNAYPREDKEEHYHEFSKDFDDRMQKILEEVKHTPIHPNVAYYKKKQRIRRMSICLASGILLFILATSILSFTNATAIPTFLMHFIKQADSDQLQVILDIDKSIPLHTNLYEPTWIPRGYKKVDEVLDKTSYTIDYQTDTGNYITYTQFEDNNYQLYTNTSNSESTTIDDITYYYKIKDTQTLIKWLNNNSEYVLTGSTDLQTLLRMAENLQRKDINRD